MTHKKAKKLLFFGIIALIAVNLSIIIPACTSHFDFANNLALDREKVKDTPSSAVPRRTVPYNDGASTALEGGKRFPSRASSNFVNFSPKTSINPALGTNLTGITDWSTQLPFVDAFKSSRAWIPQTDNVWDTGEAEKLDLDKNGWVRSLPNDSSVTYTSVGTLLFREIGGRYQGGKYVVLYDGEGTIEYAFDAKKDEAVSKEGRDVIDVTPSDAGIYLKITATDPDKTGNYLRNIRVIPAAFEDSYQQKIFNSEFLAKVQSFDALRFMDWMAINNSEQSNWSVRGASPLENRPTLQSARYSSNGVPVEVMVELANLTKTDPWFCMPHRATDEYVSKFANYIKEKLEPDLKVYVEYSNEVWNGIFAQSRWVNEQGKAQLNGDASDAVKGIDWYSKRTTEVIQIWEKVFDKEKERVIGVMAGQAANIWMAQQALSYGWTSEPRSHKDYGIDGIAIAPYFADYLGSPEHQAQAIAWTAEADGGLTKLFEELNQGGILPNSPKGGALQQAYSWIEEHAKLAQQENLQLLAYEGGQHLAGKGGVENNDAIVKLFVEANRDPRMGDIYREYLQKWFELGGDLFVNFSDIGRSSKWGSWGLLEYVNQAGSPKYDAIVGWLHRSETSKKNKTRKSL